jgi:hypothetical protein
MTYLKLYNKLIEHAKEQNRKKGSDYLENHHIIPKCLGGSNKKENMVLLTAREHFLAHKLLSKAYPENKSLFMGYHKMSLSSSENQQRIKLSSKEYEQLRIKNAFFNTGKLNWKSRPVKIYDRIFESVCLACIEMSIPDTTMRRRLNKKMNGYVYLEKVLDT